MIRATARGMQHQKPTNLRCFHSLASPACHVSHCVLRTWQAIKVTHRIPRQPRAPLRAPDQSVRKMAKIYLESDGMDKNLDLAGDFNGSKGAAAAALAALEKVDACRAMNLFTYGAELALRCQIARCLCSQARSARQGRCRRLLPLEGATRLAFLNLRAERSPPAQAPAGPG